MKRPLYGPGAHGGVIGDIQRDLGHAGFGPHGADEDYDRNTAAVCAFQKACGLPES